MRKTLQNGWSNFPATSVCKGIFLHPRLGEHLISSLFFRGCSHLEFFSSFFPCAFYFYFVLLSLALFHLKRKEYFSWKGDIKNAEKWGKKIFFPFQFLFLWYTFKLLRQLKFKTLSLTTISCSKLLFFLILFNVASKDLALGNCLLS